MKEFEKGLTAQERHQLLRLDVGEIQATVERLVQSMILAQREDASELERIGELGMALKLVAAGDAPFVVAAVAIEKLAQERSANGRG